VAKEGASQGTLKLFSRGEMNGICCQSRNQRREVVTLKRGFFSQADAEDYPIRLHLWRRVWVERVEAYAPNSPPSAG
jgi:hypothetical protein